MTTINRKYPFYFYIYIYSFAPESNTAIPLLRTQDSTAFGEQLLDGREYTTHDGLDKHLQELA